MARKRPPNKRKPSKGKPSPDTIEPLAKLYGSLFSTLMTGMIKADSVEAEYAKIREEARKLTEEQMQRLAALAGKYCAEQANRSSNMLSRDRCAILNRQALEFALKQLENETKSQE